jgi:hypothetical protein
MLSRRGLLSSTALVSASVIARRAQAASIPEASTMDNVTSQSPFYPAIAGEMETSLPKVVP